MNSAKGGQSFPEGYMSLSPVVAGTPDTLGYGRNRSDQPQRGCGPTCRPRSVAHGTLPMATTPLGLNRRFYREPRVARCRRQPWAMWHIPFGEEQIRPSRNSKAGEIIENAWGCRTTPIAGKKRCNDCSAPTRRSAAISAAQIA